MFTETVPEITFPATTPVAYSHDRRTGAITLTQLTADGVSALGTFTSPAEAWSALDAIDAP